jgi:type II secretory pathway pseudopilin PulG
MGQQQLLLVILVTIIVGIATVVAINTFGSAAGNANVSAVRNDIAQIASSAQGQYRKPAVLGGANQNWSKVTFNKMAFSAKELGGSGTKAINLNGTYVLDGSNDDYLVITAYPSSSDDYGGSIDDGTFASSGNHLTYQVSKSDFAEATDTYCTDCSGLSGSDDATGGGSGGEN